jgi:aspartyl protease family protein
VDAAEKQLAAAMHMRWNVVWVKPSAGTPWWVRVLSITALTAACTNGFAAGLATNVNVVGLFPGKALVSIDGSAPKTLSPGQKTSEGITLVSVSGDSAIFEIDGTRRTLRIGQAFNASNSAGADRDTVTLSADSTGHYITVGAINGRAVKFFVDTGASIVWIPSAVANQIGLPYRHGRVVNMTTAGGARPAWAITLDHVRVGGITLDKVEAAVGEGASTGSDVLLGTSFLSRLSMTRDGNALKLSRKDGDAPAAKSDTRPQITLTQTHNGMFTVDASLNGSPLPFLVDTGATSISIDAAMAQRIGLNYQKGTLGYSNTANGNVRSWRVKLDSVAVGPIVFYGIDATVREGPGTGGIGLLGMSFLSRVEMKRNGESLTLIKRF